MKKKSRWTTGEKKRKEIQVRVWAKSAKA